MIRGAFHTDIRINWNEIDRVVKKMENADHYMRLAVQQGMEKTMGQTKEHILGKTKSLKHGNYRKAGLKLEKSLALKRLTNLGMRFYSKDDSGGSDEQGMLGSGKDSSGGRFKLAQALEWGYGGSSKTGVHSSIGSNEKIPWEMIFKGKETARGGKRGAGVAIPPGAPGSGYKMFLPMAKRGEPAQKTSGLGAKGYNPVPAFGWLDFFSQRAERNVEMFIPRMQNVILTGNKHNKNYAGTPEEAARKADRALKNIKWSYKDPHASIRPIGSVRRG